MGGLKLAANLIIFAITLAMGARSGPFKSTYTRVEPCSKPELPLDKEPAAFFYGELYNTTTDTNLLRGKITVVRDYRVKKMKARSYIWENNKWKMNYLINNMACHRGFSSVLVMFTGTKYDLKTCTYYKEEFVFSDLNLNKIQHLWVKTQEYGKVMWKIELFSHSGTIFCWEFETLIEPADKFTLTTAIK